MSVITFLVGNGFDLACGLKSRYIDSYDEYIHSDSSSENIDRFKHTIEKDIQTWADFEMKLAGYAHNFSQEKELVECVCDYTTFLNSYLTQQQYSFFNAIKGNSVIQNALSKTMAEGLGQFYTKLTRNDVRSVKSSFYLPNGITYKFVNFNYTNVFDSLIELAFKQDVLKNTIGTVCSYSPIIHIHGQLGNDVVLGVDNENQLTDLPYQMSIRGKRNIIKPTFIEEYDNMRMKDALNTIKTSNVICVYGLALGESDLTWRKAIANWLLEESWHHLVYFKHSLAEKEYPATAITQKMDDEEDYKDRLLDILYSDSIDPEKKAQVYKQIHVPTGFNIFRIKETITSARIESLKQQEKKDKRPKENGSR